MALLTLLTSTLSRLAAPSLPDAPLPREAREMADAPRDRAAERAARDYEEARAALGEGKRLPHDVLLLDRVRDAVEERVAARLALADAADGQLSPRGENGR